MAKRPRYTDAFQRESLNQVVVHRGRDGPVCPKHCRLVDEQPNERWLDPICAHDGALAS